MKTLTGVLAAAIFAAVFCLRAATPLENNLANVQFNLALNLYKAGKLDAAAESLNKALKTVPEHPQANLLLGLVRSQQGNFKDAITRLKLASRLMPDNFDAFNNLAIAAYQTKDFETAENAFKKASEIKPENPDVLVNFGVLELSLKKWKVAEDVFGRASKLNPGGVKAWAGLAEAAENAGDKEAELNALGKSIELDPSNKVTRLKLAQKYYRADRNEDALKLLEPFKDKGDSEAEFLLGCVLYRKGHFDESRERFEAALRSRPDYPEARFNLAITLYDQDKFGDALEQFQEVLKKHPGDDQAKKNMEITRRAAVRGFLKAGSQSFLQGDYAAAMEKWRAALQLENDNKVIKDLFETAQSQLKLQSAELAGKGSLAYREGKIEDAVGNWSQALERDPDNAEAKAGMEKVLPEAKKMAGIYGKKFDTLMSEGDLNKAGEFAKKLSAVDRGQGEAALKRLANQSALRAEELSRLAEAAALKGSLLEVVENLVSARQLKKDDSSLELRLNQAKVSLRAELSRASASAKEAEAAGNHDKAIKEYRRVLELEPSNGDAQASMKRLASSNKAKAVDPAELDEWYYQGVYAYAAGETEKAMTLWKKVLVVDSSHKLATEAVKRAKNRLKALSTVK